MAWFAVRTQPRNETLAVQHLNRQGFEAYLPRYRKQRRHARRVEWIAAPLFPSYLFIRLDPEVHRWRAVNSTIGVSGLICHGERPAVVPQGVVEEIQAREDEDGLIRMAPAQGFTKGQAVRVLTGAFCDLVGLFEHTSDAERVVILLNLLGREVKVRVPADVIGANA